MDILDMGLKLRLVYLVLLLSAFALADDRVISVLPSVASMVPPASVSCEREPRSLLMHDAEVVGWRHTKWDAEIVASADTFVAIGLPQERALLEEARRVNPGLKVVNAGVGVHRIADNPYFFVSVENRDKMMKNVWAAYGYSPQVLCGDPSQTRASINAVLGFKSKAYTVAISHPAFAYACQDCGVETVMLDVDRLDEDAQYRKEKIDNLIRQRVNIVLKLPGRDGLASEFLCESRLREVEFDVFGTHLWLPSVLYENLQRRDEELAHKEELSRMYAPKLLKGVRFESFDIGGEENLARLVNRVQAALNASSDINLPIERRKLSLDISNAPGAASKRIAPSTLTNVSGLEVVKYACQTIGCDCAFCTPWITDEESLRTLFIVIR